MSTQTQENRFIETRTHVKFGFPSDPSATSITENPTALTNRDRISPLDTSDASLKKAGSDFELTRTIDRDDEKEGTIER